MGVTRQFYIASGFAPGTKDLVAAVVLFPKWLDLWELPNEGNANWLLEFGADYCLYHLSMSGQKRRCFFTLRFFFWIFFFFLQNTVIKYLEEKKADWL